MRVKAETVSLINDADTASFEGLQLAGPGYWGPDYSGMQAVVFTEFDGDQPVVTTFNYDEEEGAAMVDYTVLEGQVNPAYLPVQQRLKELDLPIDFHSRGSRSRSALLKAPDRARSRGRSDPRRSLRNRDRKPCRFHP